MTTSRRRAALLNVSGMATNTVVVSVQALILVPVYLSTFGPRLYGAWLASGEMLNFLQLFDLGLTNVVTQRIGEAHAQGDRKRVAEVFVGAVVSLALIGAILAIVALAISLALSGFLGVEGEEAAALEASFRLGALATFLFVANFSVLGLARGIQDTALQNVGTVLGSLAGFVATLLFVFNGAGLLSIAAGMCVRTAVVLITSAAFVFRLARTGDLVRASLRVEVLADFVRLSPSTTLSGIGYLLTTQTEGTIVALLLGPDQVPMLMITRRAIDVASGVLNTISYSSYAGFAHLVASPERNRALVVRREVVATWTALAVSSTAAYLAVNHSLVGAWTGPAQFGGGALSLLVALQMCVVGRLQLDYYLYRATGAIVEGSMFQFWESLLRLALMVPLVAFAGIAGPALAALVVTSPVLLILERRTDRILGSVPVGWNALAQPSALVQISVLVAGYALGSWLFVPNWTVVLLLGGMFAAASLALQLRFDASLAPVSAQITSGIVRLRGFR